MDFHIWDLPGQIDYFDPAFDTNEIFSHIGALVWVVDALDDYTESINRLTTTILNIQNTYPQVNVEVLVHKIDSLNHEYSAEIYQDIVQRVGDELNDQGYINPNVSYYKTSIYDFTIFDALSKIVQKLVPNLDTMQNLMNTLVDRSGMSKAYLFDIQTKVYVCSDTRPADEEVFRLCADYIDVIVDLSDLYGHERKHELKLGPAVDETESSMQIHDGSTIFLKEMNRFLCLVFVIKNPAAKDKKGLIDHNCYTFQDAINAVLAREWEKQSMSQIGNGDSSEAGQSAN
jgi:Ras-related GTP-binding protein C/D